MAVLTLTQKHYYKACTYLSASLPTSSLGSIALHSVDPSRSRVQSTRCPYLCSPALLPAAFRGCTGTFPFLMPLSIRTAPCRRACLVPPRLCAPIIPYGHFPVRPSRQRS